MGRGRVALATAILAATVLSPREIRAQDTGATVLRRPVLLTPAEMAGSGLEPEVRVRVDVDERGRVTGATVLAIRPPSEFDHLLREATVRNATEWRFAPARSGGVARASTLEWTVQYLAKASSESAHDLWSPFEVGLVDPRQPQARISALPRQQRGDLLNRYAAIAEKNLDQAERRRVDSPRFIVVSDAGDEETAKLLAGNFEAVFNILHGIFDPQLAPQPQPYKLVGFLFQKRDAFEQTRAALGLAMPAAGFYASPGFLAFHGELPTGDDLLSVMLHETVHAFSDTVLRRPGVLPPLWVEEGLAEYFANSQIKGGQLVPGKTLRGKFLPPHYDTVFRSTRAGATVDQLKRAVKASEAPAASEVMRATFPVFYGDDRALYYGLSWLLVHFLRHGEEGWADTGFPELMLYLAEGYGPTAALRTAYGLDDAQLDAKFTAYVRTF